MSETKHKFELHSDNNEVIIRTGNAPENFEPRLSIKINGTIDTAFQHLSKPSVTQEYIDEVTKAVALDDIIDVSYLLIDRDEMTIEFVENAGKEFESRYLGSLSLNPDFKKFKINESADYTPLQLAEFIKMNRSFFESKTEAMKLVSTLMNFEAKVNKEVEAKADERANRRVLLAQTVSTNIPESFKLKLPIFKGAEAVAFEVEIGINPVDLSCRLISPDVNDIINSTKNEIINTQKAAIQELYPDLRIFEV